MLLMHGEQHNKVDIHLSIEEGQELNIAYSQTEENQALLKRIMITISLNTEKKTMLE